MPTHAILTLDGILEHMGHQLSPDHRARTASYRAEYGARPRTHSPAAADLHWGSCPHVGATTIRKRKTTLVRWTAVR